MTHIEINAIYPDQTKGRKCGSCTACCTYLGVRELQKHTGVKCPHLLSAGHGSKRCGIYRNRPTACSSYKCFWLSGWGEAKLRPSLSGILITPYMDEETGNTVTFTVLIFNLKRAYPHIRSTLAQLLGLHLVTEVRLIYYESQRATLFKHGKIYDCELLPQESDSYESLTFTRTNPIGTYSTKEPIQ